MTLQRKVFLTTLFLFAATALLLAAAARWNLEQGFQRYTAAVELSHLDRVVENLEQAYAEHGSWDFLKADPEIWRRIQRPVRPRPPQDEQPPSARPLPPVTDQSLAPSRPSAPENPPRPPRRPPPGFDGGQREPGGFDGNRRGADGIRPGYDGQQRPPLGIRPPFDDGQGRPMPPGAAGTEGRRQPPRFLRPQGEVRTAPSGQESTPGEETQRPAGNAAPLRQAPGNDVFNIGPRLALLDAGGKQVAGQADAGGIVATRPIRHGGQVVGYLALEASPPAANALESAFLAGQTRNLLLSGALALCACLLAAWLLIRHLLAPVRELAAAARDIARGKLATRVAEGRRDELGHLATDFNSMAAQLARAEEARQAWISDASHELRTPLAVLRAEIEALQDGVRKPDEATLARLHQQVLQLGKLVDDLRGTLDGRGEALNLDLDSVSPVTLALETVESFRVRLAAAGIRVDASQCGKREWHIRGDEDRLRQVFTNLLENTLRYTNPGGRLRITGGLSGMNLVMRLEDSEPAPPAAALPRLFDRFFRAETSRSRAHGGSGLGLAICKSIVEAHGGRISAGQSELGGLAIRIQLPLEDRP